MVKIHKSCNINNPTKKQIRPILKYSHSLFSVRLCVLFGFNIAVIRNHSTYHTSINDNTGSSLFTASIVVKVKLLLLGPPVSCFNMRVECFSVCISVAKCV